MIGEGKAIAFNKKIIVISPLNNAPTRAIAVIGLLPRLIKGEIAEVNTPKTIVMRYLGYLETFEKNSPIFHPQKTEFIATLPNIGRNIKCWNFINLGTHLIV